MLNLPVKVLLPLYLRGEASFLLKIRNPELLESFWILIPFSIFTYLTFVTIMAQRQHGKKPILQKALRDEMLF